MGGALLFGRWLDAASVAPRRRAFKALAALSALVALTWSLALWVAASYGLDGAATAQPTLDAIDDPGEWALPFAIYAGARSTPSCRCSRFGSSDSSTTTATPRPLHRSVPLPPVGRRRVSWAPRPIRGLRRRAGVPPTAQAWVNVALGVASLPGALWLATTLGAEPRRCALSPTGTAAATAVARLS